MKETIQKMANLWFDNYVHLHNFKYPESEENKNSMAESFIDELEMNFEDLKFTHNRGTQEIILLTEV